MEKDTTYKIKKKKNRLFIAVLLAFTLIIFAGGLQIYAIYYIKQSSKSVAVVTGSYFTSNYLREGKTFEEVQNKTQWSGDGAYTFEIEIRNYANMLLVNDDGLDITYKLSFQFAEDPGTDCNYTVSYKNEKGETISGTIPTDVGSCYEIKDLVLTGGTEKSNEIKLEVYRKEGENSSIPVKVSAIISKPSYLTKDNNDPTLSACLVASVDSGEFAFAGEFEAMDVLNSDDWVINLNKVAGFKYTVSTSGGNEGEDYTLKIDWDPKIFSLYAADQYGGIQTSGGKESIQVKTKTNSSFTLVFFRSEKFNEEIPKLKDLQEFTHLINITQID